MKKNRDKASSRKVMTPARQITEVIGKKKKKKAASGTVLRAGAFRAAAPELELYQKESCPFSHAVRRKLSELGLDYMCHNVSDGNALKHEQLVQAGGKDQIPFLVDRRSGIKLYESGAIVAYLEAEYGRPEENPMVRYARGVAERLRANADVLAWQLRQPLDRWTHLRRDLEDTGMDVLKSFRTLRESFQSAAREEAAATASAPGRAS